MGVCDVVQLNVSKCFCGSEEALCGVDEYGWV
jgi:hypothetical protein